MIWSEYTIPKLANKIKLYIMQNIPSVIEIFEMFL